VSEDLNMYCLMLFLVKYFLNHFNSVIYFVKSDYVCTYANQRAASYILLKGISKVQCSLSRDVPMMSKLQMWYALCNKMSVSNDANLPFIYH